MKGEINMPPMKIVDVRDELLAKIESIEKDLNDKFTTLVGEIKSVLENANIDVEPTEKNSAVDTSGIEAKIDALRADVEGHVQVYNQHIVQQHPRRMK